MTKTSALGLCLVVLGTATTGQAIQGERPVRVLDGERAAPIESPAAQSALESGPAWRDLLARRGGAWFARWDESTQTPKRFYGTGWAVDPLQLADDDGAVALSLAILREERALLGRDVAPDALGRGSVDRRGDIVTVTWEQRHAGLRVDETRLSLRFKRDRFVMGQFETLPRIDAPSAPTVRAADARRSAARWLGWPDPGTLLQEELVILPIRGPRATRSALAWRFLLRATSQRSQPIVWVDATTGGVLGSEEQMRRASGTVSAEVDDRYPENGLGQEPLRRIAVSVGEADGEADDLGSFANVGSEAPVTVSARVGSDSFDIDAEDGDTDFTAWLSSDGGTALLTPDPNAGTGLRSRQRAELDVHVASHVVRDRALAIHPSFVWAETEAEVNVNLTGDECNAWFDPANGPNSSSLNFLREGGPCNNMGRVWDVLFHEYGHGFHIWNIIPGAGDFEGAIGEGFGDYMSATINDDSGMGRGFYQGSNEPLRDIAPNAVWPDDIDSDIHLTGLIAAGALWDLRTALVGRDGPQAGVATADALFWAATMRASDTPTVYDEVLLADDDNGDLSDGTPNRCLIDTAFALHGLGPGANGAGQFLVEFDPLGADLAPDEAVSVELRAALANPECAEGSVGSVVLRWSADPGDELDDFTDAWFDATGSEEWRVELPAFADGTYLRYVIEVLDDAGDVVRRLPEGSLSDPWLGAWVGGEVVYSDDFEAGEGGFTHELLAGGGQEGADDWMRETPKGSSGDPEVAWSGEWAWGNDLTPEENWNGAYQPDIHNVLRSPVIPVGDGRVLLQFRRWLTVEDGYWDQAWVAVNGAPVWENLAGQDPADASGHHADRHWAFRSYDVTELVQDGGIEVEWHLQTDQGLQFGGWTIDDVRVVIAGGGGVIGDDDDDDDDDDEAGEDDDDSPGPGSFEGQGCDCSSADAGRSAVHPGLLVMPLLMTGWQLLRRRRAP